MRNAVKPGTVVAMAQANPQAAGQLDVIPDLYQNGIMRILGQDVMTKSIRRHADIRKWLEAWAVTVEEAAWDNLGQLRLDYPSADGVKLKRSVVVTVFNVKGNEYRLLTNVNYQRQFVVVLEILTHAQYTKQIWKGRY